MRPKYIGKTIQDRKDAGLTTYCLFLDVQKAYDIPVVRRKGLWEKLWEIGIYIMRKDVENDEKIDGMMCEKCCDAGRGNF